MIHAGTNVTVTGTGSVEVPYVITATGGGGADGFLPAAQPYTLAEEELPSFAPGTFKVVTYADSAIVLAGGYIGDAFPTFVLTSNGALYFGDGTYDPSSSNNHISHGTYSGKDALILKGAEVVLSQTVAVLEGGAVLIAPDFSRHRVVVDNAGALSTVPWP